MSVVPYQYKDTNGNIIPVYLTDRVRFSFRSAYGQTPVTVDREITISSGCQFEVVYNYSRSGSDFGNFYIFAEETVTRAVITVTDVYRNMDTYLPAWSSRPTTFLEIQQFELNDLYYDPSDPAYSHYYYDGSHYFNKILSSTITSFVNNPLYVDDVFQIGRTLSTTAQMIQYGLAYNDARMQAYPAVFFSTTGQVLPGFWECLDRTEIEHSGTWGNGETVDLNSGGDEDMIGPGVKSGLFSVYVPTDFNMNRFSEWLWGSSGFDITQLKKLFEDPMQSVIDLHAIYLDITGTSNSTIHLGNIDSNIGCPFTVDTIKTLSCGSVSISETFNNVLDYDPYTKIEIYLPYIGFRSLKASEVMGGSVSVSYKIDIVTGACVALVSITKNNGTMVAYTYSGNCAISLPITGADYRGLISNITSTALGIGAAVATGGATAPLAIGAVGNLAMNSHINIQRSGTVTSNTGLLGDSKPYIIITRPVPAQATNFEQYYGFPTNQLVLLSNCSGYTRVKDCHLTVAGATETEIAEIERMLKAGVEI